MAILQINGNDVDGAASIQVRYRVLNSGATFTVNTLTTDQLPFQVNVPDGVQYEGGIRRLCNNGAYSPWVTNTSQACPVPSAFSVTMSGGNFVIAATLPGSQTMIDVQVTDPNGGISTFSHDFGGQSGTFNIAATPGLYGSYAIVGRGVCNNISDPRYVSAYTSPVNVLYSNPVLTHEMDFINSSSIADIVISALLIDGAYQIGGIPVPHSNVSSPAVRNVPYSGLSNSVIKLIVTGLIPATSQVAYGLGTISGVITGAGPYTITYSSIDLTAARTLVFTINP